MNHLFLLAGIGSDLAKSAQETGDAFGFEKARFISQCVSFLLVAAALYFWAYGPILAVLAERRKRIADGLANADKIKAELARTEAQRLEVLNQANIQANKLIEEARAAAARVQEAETQKAIAAAEQIIAKAREAAAADHARMLAELKREIGRLVVDTSSRVTSKILTPDDQKRLAEDVNRSLAA
jgi:F-type H+-transporting ATPase subunit b